MLLEKLNEFAEGKYDVSVTPAQIAQEYDDKRSDAWHVIEELNITKRIISTCASFAPSQTLHNPHSPHRLSSFSQDARQPARPLPRRPEPRPLPLRLLHQLSRQL